MMLFRAIMAILKAKRCTPQHRVTHLPDLASSLTFRVYPQDMDMNCHLNNGRYFSFLDIGRVHFLMLTQNSIKETVRLMCNYRFVVATQTIQYKKSVHVFQQIQVRTRLLSWDTRDIYFLQSMYVKKYLCTWAIICLCATNKKGQRVSPAVIHPQLSDSAPHTVHWLQKWRDQLYQVGKTESAREKKATR